MNNLRKQLYTVWVFARINTKRFFRDRMALFFGVLFPLIFLFIFGALNGHNNSVSFNVAIINQSNTQFAKSFAKEATDSKILKVNEDVTSVDKARTLMTRNQLDAAIVLPKDFGAVKPGTTYPSGNAQVIYTNNGASTANALVSILQSQFVAINKQFVNAPTPFTVQGKELTEKSLTAFDYTFAGVLGFALLGVGIFGPINVFPELKKMGILRRLSTTPLKVWQYFTATMLSQIATGAVSLALMFIVAIIVFHYKVVGNWVELAVFIILGMMMLLGIGLALGGWAKNERQVAPLAQIVIFPMMFLSGTFFPRYIMPEWLQNVSSFIPLSPVIDGIRLIATEGYSFVQIAPQLGLVLGWIVVIYLIAFRVFRWE